MSLVKPFFVFFYFFIRDKEKQLMIRSVHTPFRKQTDKSCLCEKTNDFLRYYIAHNLQLLMVGFIHLNNISVFVALW